MNFSAVLGFLICAVVLFVSVTESEGARHILVNQHAIVVVLGGTLAATFISFPVGKVFALSFLALKRLLGVATVRYDSLIREVIGIAEAVESGTESMDSLIQKVADPFLREGMQLLIDGATEEQLQDILSTRIETIRRRHGAEANMFRTIGKFPPAFGLLGTTLGMITLLNQLGGPDAQKLVGPAMAIGLVATLYGIGFTNFLFIPIAENLSAMSAEDYAARQMTLEGLLMIKKKVHPALVEEKMKSYLLPSERGLAKGAKNG